MHLHNVHNTTTSPDGRPNTRFRMLSSVHPHTFSKFTDYVPGFYNSQKENTERSSVTNHCLQISQKPLEHACTYDKW